MKILVINAGSSSLKYQLIDMETEHVLAKGLCERIGLDGHLKHTPLVGGKPVFDEDLPMPTHSEAIAAVIDKLTSAEYGVVASMKEIDAVGHRVVHGGESFAESVLIDEDVLRAVEACTPLAPLHNNPEANVIEYCLEQYPDLPNVTVYDTAFHFNMPEVAKTYALPKDVCDKLHIRKYGAHGTSYRYISKKVAEMTNGEARKVVVARTDISASAADELDEPIVVCVAHGTCVTPKDCQRKKIEK